MSRAEGPRGNSLITGITHSTRKQKSNSIHKASQFLSSRIFGVSVNQPSIRLSFNLSNDQVILVRCSRTNDRDCRAGNRVCGFRCLPKPKARRSGYTPLVTASLMFEVLPQLTETPVGIKPIDLVWLGSSLLGIHVLRRIVADTATQVIYASFPAGICRYVDWTCSSSTRRCPWIAIILRQYHRVRYSKNRLNIFNLMRRFSIQNLLR